MDDKHKNWKGILNYWYSATIHQLIGGHWDNTIPHTLDTDEIPTFFHCCLNEFKDYYRQHYNNDFNNINSKIIYKHLMEDQNYNPSTLTKFPGLDVPRFFLALYERKLFSPELKEFLFKLYHGRL